VPVQVRPWAPIIMKEQNIKILLIDRHETKSDSVFNEIKDCLKKNNFKYEKIFYANKTDTLKKIIKFRKEKTLTITVANRIPERFILMLLKTKFNFMFQHGQRSTLNSKFTISRIAKSLDQLPYIFGFFLKQKKIDCAFLFNKETAILYDGIHSDTKIIKITKKEQISEKLIFNKSSKNILFIDQPIKGQGIINDNDYEKKISILNNYGSAMGCKIFFKKHPRSTFKNQFNWIELNEHIDCLIAVGFSSSLLINLSNDLPVFSLLDQHQMPKHLTKKVKFELPRDLENIDFEKISMENKYICSCLTDQLQFMDVKRT
tara:strand:+ start:4754 stop:5704 length:951 start_codon:yes stop_codon:yes gene_type:complete